MVVSEKNISDALTYLADDPHPIARARYELTLAENSARETYARLFLQSDGPNVKTRECQTESHKDYALAKSNEADAVLDYERHRSRVKAAEMLLEIWRTENANARAAERVR